MYLSSITLLTLWVQVISGQTNPCPRTTDYTFCPVFDFDDEVVGECPSGWSCTGDAEVFERWNILFFKVGGDDEVGSATSDYLPVPQGAVDLNWERCGGADEGGVIIEDSEGNTICDERYGEDTNVFLEQTCNLEAYVGECIRIYTWDAERYVLLC